MDPSKDPENLTETSSDVKPDEAIGAIQDVIQDSLAKMNSQPSTSGRHKNKLRRSLSYPPTITHICQDCTGLCVCSRFRYFTDDKVKANPRCSRKVRQTKRSQSCIQDCSLQELSFELVDRQEAVSFLLGAEPSSSATPEKVLFPQAEQEHAECQVCLVPKMSRRRSCCGMPVCDICIQTYIREKVNHRVVIIRCLNPACHSFICKEEILHHLSSELYEKFLRFLAEDNNDPSQKTCPKCNRIAKFDHDVIIRTHKTQPNEHQVACACGLLWCFRCHAPWHDNMSCRENLKGDRLLKSWAKERHFGERNAKKCPECKIYIQRNAGCDNMTCSRCNTSFCYSCGGRFYKLLFFGSHSSRFSVFGCKYRFKPHEPVKRRMIRGSLFGCQLLLAPVCLTAAVAFFGVFIVAAGPWFITKRIRRNYKRRQHIRRTIKQAQLYQEYLAQMNSLYSGKEIVLTPRSATLLDLPPSRWQLHTNQRYMSQGVLVTIW